MPFTGHHDSDALPSPSNEREYENFKIPRRRVSIIVHHFDGKEHLALLHSEQVSNASLIGLVRAEHGGGFRLQTWLQIELQDVGYVFLED